MILKFVLGFVLVPPLATVGYLSKPQIVLITLPMVLAGARFYLA